VKYADHKISYQARGGPWTGPRKPFSGRKRKMSSPTRGMTDRGLAAPRKLPNELAFELARSEDAHAVAVSRAEPPSEVLEQVLLADSIGQMLREEDRELTFSLSPENRLLGIELRNSSGELLRAVSAVEAMEIATGRPVE